MEVIKQKLKELKLSGMARSLEVRNEYAISERLSFMDFANGKIKYPKMGKKMTHFFCSRLYGLGSFKAVESSFSERKITRRDWDVRSSHAYNH